MALNLKIFISCLIFMSSILAKKTLHRAVNLYIIKYVEYFSRLIKISLQILRRQCAPRHESDPRSARNFNDLIRHHRFHLQLGLLRLFVTILSLPSNPLKSLKRNKTFLFWSCSRVALCSLFQSKKFQNLRQSKHKQK